MPPVLTCRILARYVPLRAEGSESGLRWIIYFAQSHKSKAGVSQTTNSCYQSSSGEQIFPATALAAATAGDAR